MMLPKVMPQMKQNKHQLNEHLSENDLKWLVDDNILIDMHKTKLGEDRDYMVLSIAVKDRTPAHDLAKFIESSVYKYADVEVSPATDKEGRYLIYVEMERSPEAYKTISGILTDSKRLCGIENWKFKTMGLASHLPFDESSFSSHVITDPALYEQRHPKPVEVDTEPDSEPELAEPESDVQESIKSRLKFLLTY
jgi:hypothetical protein